MALVSVLVPVYKVEQHIERCARSLFEQTLQDIEYVFVDDCSPDNSIAVLEKTAQEYPDRQIKIVHHEKNKGLSAARNTAIRNATGKYWICCDSDDWVEPDMYESMLAVAEEENADIVCCGFVMEGEINKVVSPDFVSETKEDIVDSKRFGLFAGAQWNKLVRAELYQKHGILTLEGVNMWEDICVTYPLRLYSRKTVYIPDCYYHYNVVGGSLSHGVDTDKLIQMSKAIKFLETVFEKNNLKEEAYTLLNNMKLHVVDGLLYNFSIDNLRLIRKTFPEANVWKYDEWDLRTKIKRWCLFHVPMSFYASLRRLKHALMGIKKA